MHAQTEAKRRAVGKIQCCARAWRSRRALCALHHAHALKLEGQRAELAAALEQSEQQEARVAQMQDELASSRECGMESQAELRKAKAALAVARNNVQREQQRGTIEKELLKTGQGEAASRLRAEQNAHAQTEAKLAALIKEKMAAVHVQTGTEARAAELRLDAELLARQQRVLERAVGKIQRCARAWRSRRALCALHHAHALQLESQRAELAAAMEQSEQRMGRSRSDNVAELAVVRQWPWSYALLNTCREAICFGHDDGKPMITLIPVHVQARVEATAKLAVESLAAAAAAALSMNTSTVRTHV